MTPPSNDPLSLSFPPCWWGAAPGPTHRLPPLALRTWLNGHKAVFDPPALTGACVQWPRRNALPPRPGSGVHSGRRLPLPRALHMLGMGLLTHFGIGTTWARPLMIHTGPPLAFQPVRAEVGCGSQSTGQQTRWRVSSGYGSVDLGAIVSSSAPLPGRASVYCVLRSRSGLDAALAKSTSSSKSRYAMTGSVCLMGKLGSALLLTLAAAPSTYQPPRGVSHTSLFRWWTN